MTTLLVDLTTDSPAREAEAEAAASSGGAGAAAEGDPRQRRGEQGLGLGTGASWGGCGGVWGGCGGGCGVMDTRVELSRDLRLGGWVFKGCVRLGSVRGGCKVFFKGSWLQDRFQVSVHLWHRGWGEGYAKLEKA